MQTQTYTYDASDRITSVCFLASCTAGSPELVSWTYDKVGNRLSEARSSGTTSYAYDARDRLLSAGSTSYTYDQNGNELSARSSTFTYDLANRLKTAIQGTTTTTYTYDGDSKRLQASTGTANSAKTNFLWDVSHGLPQLAQERNGANTLQRQYIYGLKRIRQSQGTGTYYLYDGLGSVANTLAPLGALQKTYSYEPYGAIRTETGSSPLNFFHFAGEYRDPTLLYHLRARQYDPGSGRFLHPDPVDPGAGSPLLASYVYAADRPTVLVDPSGMVVEFREEARNRTDEAVSVVPQDPPPYFPKPKIPCAARPGYPLGRIGIFNGGPNVRGTTHDPDVPPNNWQSDNAIDLNVPVGTRVCAVFGGKVPSDRGIGFIEGAESQGKRVYVRSGPREAFYLHLSRIVAKKTDEVERGDLLGYSGQPLGGAAHLHLAYRPPGNPLTVCKTIQANPPRRCT